MDGIVFNIQRYSLHDGPGIRTLIFLKGCPLKCKWCSNPEGQQGYSEIGFISSRCVGIDDCIAPCTDNCPNEAIKILNKKPVIDRDRCRNCGNCASNCLYEALFIFGKRMSAEQIIAEIKKDEQFYLYSGGGVTIGGGEPLAQFNFIKELVKRLKENYLNIAIETCGYVPWQYYNEIINQVDTIYYDIKHMDPKKHKEFTGAGNELILRNAKKLISHKEENVIIRIPLIFGYNDSEKNIRKTGEFIIKAGGLNVEFLPYHKLGESKYRQLGKEYGLGNIKDAPPGKLMRLRTIFKLIGLNDLTIYDVP